MGENFVIVAGGILYDADKVLSKIPDYDEVIAVDLGYENARKLGLKPSVFIGDFDSCANTEIECEVIKFDPVKDVTDLRLAVDFAVKNNAKKLTFLCCTGGRLDHLLNNFSILNYAFSLGIECQMIDEFNVVEPIKSMKKYKNISKYVSIVPICEKICLSVSNMKYPMENMTVNRENIVSISNECTCDEFEIVVNSGSGFVIFAD